MSALLVKSTATGARFSVHVQPRASRTELAGMYGSALKVRLHALPAEGAANAELISFLALALGVGKRDVRIISGLSSRSKTIEVDGVLPASVRALAEGAALKK